MAADTSSEISKKYEELRNIGNELAALTGREPKFGKKDSEPRLLKPTRRITVDKDDDDEKNNQKRPRLIYDSPVKRSADDNDDDYPPLKKPTVQSSVKMLTIESKSREQTIAERRNSQKVEDGQRNKRMFGNLLMGTLKQFQKEGKTPAMKQQTEKLKEVEEKLAQNKKEEEEKFLNDKKMVEQKMRQKDAEIKRLKQKRAIQLKNEAKINHYKQLQNFIQTETKPPIFFLPARHSIRTMELLKNTSRNLEGLIKERHEAMETEIRDLEELSDGEIAPAVRSEIKVVSNVIAANSSKAHLRPIDDDGDIDDDIDEDSDEEEPGRLRSIVVKTDNKDEKIKEESSKELTGDEESSQKIRSVVVKVE